MPGFVCGLLCGAALVLLALRRGATPPPCDVCARRHAARRRRLRRRLRAEPADLAGTGAYAEERMLKRDRIDAQEPAAVQAAAEDIVQAGGELGHPALWPEPQGMKRPLGAGGGRINAPKWKLHDRVMEYMTQVVGAELVVPTEEDRPRVPKEDDKHIVYLWGLERTRAEGKGEDWKVYVGSADNISRVEEEQKLLVQMDGPIGEGVHPHFPGALQYWFDDAENQYRPVSKPLVFRHCLRGTEDSLTLHLMAHFGFDNVRGGMWATMDINPSARASAFLAMRHLRGGCLRCARRHHLWDPFSQLLCSFATAVDNILVRHKRPVGPVLPCGRREGGQFAAAVVAPAAEVAAPAAAGKGVK
eukprot:gene34467-63281_t